MSCLLLLPVCLVCVCSLLLLLIFFPSFPGSLVMAVNAPSPPYPINIQTHTHRAPPWLPPPRHQPAPLWMEPLASTPPVVSLDWIQLGRLFALQSFVGSMDDRFVRRPAHSLTHTRTHKHAPATSISPLSPPFDSMHPPRPLSRSLTSPSQRCVLFCSYIVYTLGAIPCFLCCFMMLHSTRSRHEISLWGRMSPITFWWAADYIFLFMRPSLDFFFIFKWKLM